MTDRSRGVKNIRKHAKMLISKIIPFEEWLFLKERSKEDIKMYHSVCDNLKELSEIKDNDFQTIEIH